MNKGQFEAVKKFYDSFSKKVNEKVISLEMVSFKANSAALEILKLKKNLSTNEIWGLFVFCEKSLYFFVHAYESPITLMFRQAAHGSEPEEQLVNISTLKSVEFSLPQKKMFDYIFPGNRKIFMKFKDTDEMSYTVEISAQHKIEDVFEKIQNILKK